MTLRPLDKSNAELQMQRGSYLNAMALADRTLTIWFSQRLGVPQEALETFYRLVETGSLGDRIELFGRLHNGSQEHRDVYAALKAANSYRNMLAHGGVFHSSEPDSSFAQLGEWEIQHWKRTGLITDRCQRR